MWNLTGNSCQYFTGKYIKQLYSQIIHLRKSVTKQNGKFLSMTKIFKNSFMTVWKYSYIQILQIFYHFKITTKTFRFLSGLLVLRYISDLSQLCILQVYPRYLSGILHVYIRYYHMAGHFLAEECFFADFEIAVIFYPVIKSLWKFLWILFGCSSTQIFLES